MNLKLTLAQKLALVFVAFASALVIGVGTFSYTSGRNALEDATLADLLAVALEKQAALDGWIKEQRMDIAALAQSLVLAQQVGYLVDDPDAATAQAAHSRLVPELRVWTAKGQSYFELMVLHPQTGQVIASTDATAEGKYRENRPYFIQGRDEPYVQNVYYSLILSAPAMTASAPIHAADGRLLGVLAGRLNLDEVDAIMQRRTELHQTDDAYLVNAANLFVTQPRLISDRAVLRRGVHTEPVERCLAHESGTISATDYRGQLVLSVFRWLPAHELCLITEIDQAEAFAPIHNFRTTIALIGGLALLGATLLGAGLARTITHPIRKLVRGTQEITRGNLRHRLDIQTGDELGQLASAFNEMTIYLQQSVTELRRHRDRLEEIVEERTQELARSNAELEQFAYVASHDLQEPLRMIRSYLQLLDRRYKAALDADARDFIDFAVDGAQRMQQLIDDLLVYSRVGTRGRDLEPTDCEEVLGAALKDLEVAIEESSATVSHDALPTVMADDVQLRQLFQNLISNAIKFHGEAPPAVHISAEHQSEQWQFAVRDNGIGMEPKFSERIFVIFQRLHTREEYGGTGIGLAVSKRIVERHGGEIWVESAAGEGSTFYFTLPAESDR